MGGEKIDWNQKQHADSCPNTSYNDDYDGGDDDDDVEQI
ncbi:unnamed protein product, partial [Rotaria socialis]